MKTIPTRTVLIVDGVRAADFGLLAPFAKKLGLELLTAVGRDAGELTELTESADVLMVKAAHISRQVLAASPRLRLVYKLGTLTSNIDTEAAAELGIEVRTTPIPSAIAVAEHTLSLMLAVARHLLQAHRAVLDGKRIPDVEPQRTTELSYAYNWASVSPATLLHGKTLGLIGLGEIGTQVAIRAAAFGMGILYYKRSPLGKEPEDEYKVAYRPLEQLLREADVISLHLPSSAASEKLLNRDRLKLVKRSAILVNTSRGGIIDEAALVDALSSGALAGAGLDVFEYEPLPRDSRLLQLDNVVLTPHMAGAGLEAWRTTLRDVLTDIAGAGTSS
jgi:phosphoglycerate dehydrogenase-like enzyme